jgi:4-hydroxy-2-oxoheptanedioate aldolase
MLREPGYILILEVFPMRPNKLRELLKADKPTLSTHIHTTWPSVVEAIGHTGVYDYVEFVGEYGPYDLHDLDNLCRAAELYDMSMMIKVDQEPRGFLAQRAIGSGFHSVLFADCRSADDVRECVRIVRPETPEDGGTYGVATRRFTYMGYGGSQTYVQALRDIVVTIMIEKPGTVDNLEAVLEVPGVDMVQWGGSDYSMGIGRAGERNSPELKRTERRVFETALKMGVPPRAEINTADQAKEYLDMGVRHFCIGTDINILHQWWKAHGDNLRKALDGN